MLQLREKASQAKSEAGGLAPLAHGVLEAQKEEQRRASELAALKRYITTSVGFNSQYAHRHFQLIVCIPTQQQRQAVACNSNCCMQRSFLQASCLY